MDVAGQCSKYGGWIGWIVAVNVCLLGGCDSRVSFLTNSNPSLRKSPADFATDAANRHPFKEDVASGGEAKGRAMVDYGSDTLEIVNLSDEDWNNVEIWVNRKFVVFIPQIGKNAPKTTTLSFQMLYDGAGNSFPTNNMLEETNRIHQLEMLRDGKLYTLKTQLAD